LFLPTLLLLPFQAAAQSQTPSKVGIIHIQNAIMSTREGQKAATDLQARFDPSKGSNTMAEEKRLQLTRDIDQKTRSLNRDSEDTQAEFEQEQNKLLNQLGQKIMAVIDKHARDNGFSLILDVSSPQTPVLYAANGIDITKDIVDLYDKNAPPPAASAKPAPPPPAKPPVSVPPKK
jgi:outer membrane protein